MAALASTIYNTGSAAPARRMRITGETLSRAFTTAVMLTANAEQAGAAILEGIGMTDPSLASDEELFLAAVRAAVEHKRCDAGPGQRQRASSMLPQGLRAVPGLPLRLRHCFVLRILAGLPAAVCAQWMHLTTSEVERAAGRAAKLLAGISACAAR